MIKRAIFGVLVGLNFGAVAMMASMVVQSFAIRCMRSANLRPRWGRRLAKAATVCAYLGPLAFTTLCRGHSARISRLAAAERPTSLDLSTCLVSAITTWIAVRRSIEDSLGDYFSYVYLLDVEAGVRGRASRRVGEKPTVDEKPFEAPACPHPSDPRVDDRCPICCDDLAGGVGLALLIDRGSIRVHVDKRQLSKCRRCGSVAHTECVFAMMIVRADAGGGLRNGGGNPCAICRPMA